VVGFSVAGYFVFSPINEDKEIPVKTPTTTMSLPRSNSLPTNGEYPPVILDQVEYYNPPSVNDDSNSTNNPYSGGNKRLYLFLFVILGVVLSVIVIVGFCMCFCENPE